MSNLKINFIKDALIVIVLLLIPLLIFSHTFYNDEGNVIKIFGIQIEHNLGSNNLFVWLLMLKVMPFCIFSVWFLTCFYKWKYYILLPIAIQIDSIVGFLLIEDYTIIKNVVYSFFAILGTVILLIQLNKYYLKNFEFIIIRESLPKLILSKQSENFYLRIAELTNQDKWRSKSNKHQLGHLIHLLNSLKSHLQKEREFTLQPKLKGPYKTLAVSCLLLISILFYVHHIVPDVDEIRVGAWKIGNYGFGNVNIFLWLFFVKFTLLLGLSVWFITNLEWWRYAILPGIVLTSYQLWELFQSSTELDSSSNLNTFPVIAIILGLLLISIKKVNYKFKLIDIYNWIKEEIDRISKQEGKSSSVILKETLERLKKSDNESELDAGLRLQRLLALKEEIQKQINKKD